MKAQLRILHLEDSPSDRELIRQLLAGEGIDCHVLPCDCREKFLKALQQESFDLIFADCTLPEFSGIHALELARKHAPEIPFIFVSGTIEEEIAIESLRSGATDYVLKDRLSRLAPAVRRAMAEAKERAKSHEMEQQLRQAQRLEAVGTLAGGVAHDFNNILAIIKGHTSLLLLESEKARLPEIVATIEHATQRGAELVSQLLAFARKSDGDFIATDINQRIRATVAMLREAFPRNINFSLDLDDNLPEIDADPGQVERVLINLATNARDAMPKGGMLTFTTCRQSRDQVPASADKEAEEYLCLRVADTGLGMDEATRQRIFEPFFTTKGRGKGTGLGMPVVYGLMQSHEGMIDIKSEVGKGTSISLFFPIPVQPAAHAVETPTAGQGALVGTENILVVDDEKDVSYFVELILKSHGYQVLSAQNAEEALEILRFGPEEVHLLFSDLGLPDMNGFDLSLEARKLKPHLKTIMTSGYADNNLRIRMSEGGIDTFIAKPYDMTELLQTVRIVLDKK